jgi:hypothetical protein
MWRMYRMSQVRDLIPELMLGQKHHIYIFQFATVQEL